MKAEHAIAAIEHRELRVSRIRELNDPFELMPGLVTHPSAPPDLVDRTLNFLVDAFNDDIGIICMAKAIALTDPVIWSHYSDGHKGIALGFDQWVTDELFPMTYPKKRPTMNIEAISRMNDRQGWEEMKNILSAKAPSWEYESECRFFVNLAGCRVSAGHYFTPIPDNYLKHVVPGIRCDISVAYIKNSLKQSKFDDVTISKARCSSSEFKVEFS